MKKCNNHNPLAVMLVTALLFLAANNASAEEKTSIDVGSNSLYRALSHPPVRAAGNHPDMSVYRPQGTPKYGNFRYKAPAEGLLQVGGAHSTKTVWSDNFEIAWTKMGNKGPLVLFLHGVPTNRTQWEGVQGQVSRFAETISIDMLGMGDSSKPRLYGHRNNPKPNDLWNWKYDIDYIDKLMKQEYPGRKFIFVADDWGGGIATQYAAKYNNRLNALVLLDPIAFDGYPVNEIQAIGRASEIPNTPEGDSQFGMMFAAFDQTLVQIMKTMVYDPTKYNQYNMRYLTYPYVDVDYERNGSGDGVSDVAKSTTMRLKLHNMRVLADRAAILSPALLLPYHPKHNPNGIRYQDITVPALIMWGEYDNMMPAMQTQRFANVLGTNDVQITYIPRAGHFAATDNPNGVADTLINFTRRVSGRSALADIYVGNDGIWKGDERQMIQDLRVLHKISK